MAKATQKQSLKKFLTNNFSVVVGAMSFTIVGVLLLAYSQAAITPYFSGAAERDQVTRINSTRSSYRAAALWHIDCLNNLAEYWSKTMGSKKTLYHNPNLTANVSSYCGPGYYNGSTYVATTYVGENVGKGPNSATIYSGFMASTAHKTNIINKNFNRMGVGVYVDSSGYMWVTQIFAKCYSNCTNGKWNKTVVYPN